MSCKMRLRRIVILCCFVLAPVSALGQEKAQTQQREKQREDQETLYCPTLRFPLEPGDAQIYEIQKLELTDRDEAVRKYIELMRKRAGHDQNINIALRIARLLSYPTHGRVRSGKTIHTYPKKPAYPEKAIQVYQMIIDKYPDATEPRVVFARVKKAKLQLDIKDYGGAMEEFEAILDLKAKKGTPTLDKKYLRQQKRFIVPFYAKALVDPAGDEAEDYVMELYPDNAALLSAVRERIRRKAGTKGH